MFAYVSFKDGKREIVPTKDIRNFDEISFDRKQLYNVRWTDGYFYEGAIAFVGGKILHSLPFLSIRIDNMLQFTYLIILSYHYKKSFLLQFNKIIKF